MIITGRAVFRRVVVVVISCVLAGSVLVACSGGGVSSSSSSTASPAATLPDTPAGAQARWLIAAMAALPIGTAELRAHFDAGFLAQISPAKINQTLPRLGDVLRVVSIGVSQPGLSPVADVLQINDGSLGLDPAQWQTTWFNGGSEPGVLTLTYMATTRTGHSYVAAILAENPSAPIGEATATPAMLSAIKGAFTLAAHG